MLKDSISYQIVQTELKNMIFFMKIEVFKQK